MTDSLQGKRVLVTGGAGVIGRELLCRLCERETEVLSVDREPLAGGPMRGVRHVRLDLADGDLGGLGAFRPQVVMHLAAAFERAVETPEFWETNWHDNVLCSHRVLDLMRTVPGIEVFVFASSYLVYCPGSYLYDAPPDRVCYLGEDAQKWPRNLCGASKLCTERELEFLREAFSPSTRTVSARIYRVYGHGSRDVVSRWVGDALAGRDIHLYNAENRFDYVFAGEVAEGLVRLAECEQAQGAVNLGFGRSRSVGELVEIIARAVPGSRGLVRDEGRKDLYEASGADLTRLEALTGWRPGTDLERGVSLLIEHKRSQRFVAELPDMGKRV